MRHEFAKLNGLGNDFVMIENMDGAIGFTSDQVALICDRHFGVGADGVILVNPSPRDECAAYMHYINSDGSLAQMCGNGVRCFAKFLVDRNLVDPSVGEFVADTLAGPRPIKFRIDTDGRMLDATVDMGEPILDPEYVPIDADASMKSKEGVTFVGNLAIPSPWGDFEFTAVSMGNPHAVTFIDDWNLLPDGLFKDPSAKSMDTFDIDLVGAFYESNPIFPEKSNIEFAEIADDCIRMRVFERGCGETLACGTGACATNVAAALTGRASRDNTVRLLGGELEIEWLDNNHVMMTGPAMEAFTGTIDV